jgi:NADPH-dependent glutamate synthase beta subunit-like oxidoreductase/NAD-dependent dihydropyrimidine dehydrogenase PreA subunit
VLKTVDQNKCVGCGACQKVCALDVFRLDPDRSPVSPCMTRCPIHNDMRAIHYLLQMGDITSASAMLNASNPLASITGRVCPHTCELECARNKVDSSVNIGAIEQYLGDYILNMVVAPVTRQHVAAVAVVGSGPAGLSCAHFLAAKGFEVTIFEARAEVGGMLRYSIPVYRLPNHILSSIIGRLEDMGVVIKCNHAVNSLDELQAQGFRAVFVATGAGKSKKLNIPGIEGKDVYYGLEFLEAVRTGLIRSMPATVMIVGGGDVAMDAAQTARRLGAQKVTVLALEEETCLPAYRHNVDSALAEGIEFVCSWGIESLSREGNDTSTVHAIRCVSVFDGTGAFAPQYDRAARQTFSANVVVLAIGQEPDLSLVPRHLIGAGGFIQVKPGTQQTASPAVFAAGDVVDGPASIAQAVGAAKKAATAIECFLGGIEIEGQEEERFEAVTDFPAPELVQRARRREKESVKRTDNSFSELYTGFDLVETLIEAERCMTCGAKSIAEHLDDCMTCFACELNCPSGAIFVHPFKEVLPRSFRPAEPSQNGKTIVESFSEPLNLDVTRERIGGDNEPRT